MALGCIPRPRRNRRRVSGDEREQRVSLGFRVPLLPHSRGCPPGMLGGVDLPFDPREQFGHGQTEAPGDGQDGLYGEIAFATFDSAHVGPVQAAMVCKGLLREPLLGPKFPNSFA